ncbi:MAG TPA: 2-phosphosulfolactate phosphatase [Tepidisphaeraceae bacterium]
MIQIDVVPLPRLLEPAQLTGRAVAVFDVLRATTTMAYALSAGAKEVRLFDSLEAAKDAAAQFVGEKILCGERQALRPAGFDLGNSPGEFISPRVEGRTLFMATTNGTRAIVAASHAEILFAAALVNARATAAALLANKLDVTLLCAGTNGEIAPEDRIGAGAVATAMQSLGKELRLGEETRQALQLFQQNRSNLLAALRAAPGGQNCIAAGLGDDIEPAAKLDRFDLVIGVHRNPLIAHKLR